MAPSTYRLTAAQLREIGSGYGDAGCLEVLRAGQAARRRLLLRAVAEAAPTTRPALDLIRRVANVSPDLAESTINRPFLGVWASRWLCGNPVGTDYLFGLAAAAGVHARLTFELTSTEAATGSFTLPGLGTAFGLGSGPVSIRASATTLSVSGSGGRVSVDAPFRTEIPGVWHVHRRSGAFLIEDLDPYRACFGLPVSGRLSEMDARRFRALIGEAWQIVQRDHPRHAEAMAGSLTTIVPLLPQDVSAASRLAFGAIGVFLPDDPQTLALLMIHEFQHAKLGAVLDIVDLYVDDGVPRYWAPWRAEPRPIGALIQGIYAHVGVIDYWRVRQRTVPSRLAQLEFALWLEQTSRATVTLRGSGRLNEAGSRFAAYLADTLHRWHAELGPSGAHDCAIELSDLAAVKFRLQNHTPTATVRPAPGAAEPSPLALLLRQRFLEPGTAPLGHDTDVAYALGEYDRAFAGYQARLQEDGGHEDAWGGLALTLRRFGRDAEARAIVDRPEAVHTVWRQAGGNAVEAAARIAATATADRYRS